MGFLDWISGPGALHEAAEAGNVKLVKELLARGTDVNAPARTTDREPALLRAANSGHLEIVQLLIRGGADVNARTADGGTSLHYATEHPEIVRELIAKGADVDAKGYKGATALHLAAAGGHVDAVRFLLENGASVDATDDSGRTPFQLAAHWKQVQVGRLLAKAGAQEPAARRREAKRKFWAAIDETMGLKGTAEISDRGHPVCPICAKEFPVSEKEMRERSGGRPTFNCPSCGSHIGLAVEDDGVAEHDNA